MMAESNYYYHQRRRHTKQIVKAVAWLQMLANAVIVGILLHSWFLIHTKRGQTILQELLATYYSPLADRNTFGAEKFALATVSFTSSAGLLTGLTLLEGTRRGILLNLKLWLVYAVVFINLDLAVHLYIGWPTMTLCCRMAVTTAFYCFGAWAVASYIEELSHPYDPLSFTIPTTVLNNSDKDMEKGQLNTSLSSMTVKIPTIL